MLLVRSGVAYAVRERVALAGALVLLLWAATLEAQRSNVQAVQTRLRQDALLSAGEVRTLMQAVREELGYKAVRLSPTAPPPRGSSRNSQVGVEMLMGSDGRPLWLREAGDRPDWRRFGPSRTREVDADSVTLTHFTRRAATRCDGTLTADELVIEYRKDGTGWTATARLLTQREFATPLFALLTGEVVPIDAGRQFVLERSVRALAAPWSPDVRTGERRGSTVDLSGLVATRGSTSGLAVQRLSIDEGTLLPVRWSLALNTSRTSETETTNSREADSELYFSYDRSIAFSAPPGVDVPPCVA